MIDYAEPIDLGFDHKLKFAAYKDDPRAGATVIHLKPDGTPCEGWITFKNSAWHRSFDGEIPAWDVLCWEPLTVQPSLLCRCGDHGFITNGRWVKA